MPFSPSPSPDSLLIYYFIEEYILTALGSNQTTNFCEFVNLNYFRPVLKQNQSQLENILYLAQDL